MQVLPNNMCRGDSWALPELLKYHCEAEAPCALEASPSDPMRSPPGGHDGPGQVQKRRGWRRAGHIGAGHGMRDAVEQSLP